jgi:acyl-CoA thioesterase
VGVIAGGVSLDNTIRIARQWIDTGSPGGADGGWILLDVTVESVIGDVAQLSARVFDPAGRLLAVAGQSAILRRFPRAE